MLLLDAGDGTQDVALTHHGDRRVHITSLIWLPEIIAKLEVKHGVTVEEIEEVFEMGPVFRRGPKGKRRGEDVYRAYGRSEAGRYLAVAFIYKLDRRALILSGREMTTAELRLYRRR